MIERLRRLNWPMVVAGLLATLIVVTMFINAVAGAQRVQHLEERDADKDRVHAAERRELSAHQDELLAIVHDLQTEAKADAKRDAALIAWLQSRGIRVPVGLIAERVDTDGDGDDDSDQVDRDAAQRERDARPKAPSPSKGNGGGSGGDNGGPGGDGPGNPGGQSQSPGRSDGGGSKGRGSGGSDHSEGRSAEHRRS